MVERGLLVREVVPVLHRVGPCEGAFRGGQHPAAPGGASTVVVAGHIDLVAGAAGVGGRGVQQAFLARRVVPPQRDRARRAACWCRSGAGLGQLETARQALGTGLPRRGRPGRAVRSGLSGLAPGSTQQEVPRRPLPVRVGRSPAGHAATPSGRHPAPNTASGLTLRLVEASNPLRRPLRRFRRGEARARWCGVRP